MVEAVDILDIISEIFGISLYTLVFPDFIFYVIIPAIIVFFGFKLFFDKILRRWGVANNIIAGVVTFLLLRFIYPIIFFISLVFILFIEKWPRNFLFRIAFIGLIIALYWKLFPFLSEIAKNI